MKERRRRGSGTFVTRAQIERSHATRLTDLFRGLAGVSVSASDNGTTIVELRGAKRLSLDTPAPARAAPTDSGAPPPPPAPAAPGMSIKRCPAGFLLDGFPIDGNTGLDLGMNADMIEAIELYPSAQVPIEYAGRHSECGLVMIWTRAYADRPAPGA